MKQFAVTVAITNKRSQVRCECYLVETRLEANAELLAIQEAQRAYPETSVRARMVRDVTAPNPTPILVAGWLED